MNTCQDSREIFWEAPEYHMRMVYYNRENNHWYQYDPFSDEHIEDRDITQHFLGCIRRMEAFPGLVE